MRGSRLQKTRTAGESRGRAFLRCRPECKKLLTLFGITVGRAQMQLDKLFRNLSLCHFRTIE